MSSPIITVDVIESFIIERFELLLKQVSRLNEPERSRISAEMIKNFESSGLGPQTTRISPDTPFTNKKIFWDTLRTCQGHIYWVDKFFTRPGLELISQASLDSNKVKEIKVLMCSTKVDEDFRKLFKNLRDELRNKGITFEIRAITDKKTERAIHDRFILSETNNYNVVSPDVMARGQYSEILKTHNEPPPFDKWWNSSKNIIVKWDEIKTYRSRQNGKRD